jgi:molybdate/tungstate transport system substrate-binding protein
MQVRRERGAPASGCRNRAKLAESSTGEPVTNPTHVPRRTFAAVALWLAAGCAGDGGRPGEGPLLVYNAASVTRPMRAVLDSFALRTGVRYEQESASSLELARRLTELQSTPDVLVLADPDLFPALLEPAYTSWHALFGRNRIVLAYTARSRGAADIAGGRWWEVLERPGVQVGRSDPDADPSGYRTLLVWQLAARHYGIPDLPARMLRASPARNVRPREADQVALLQAGELDYIWTYENLATLMSLPYLKLPDAVDLGSADDSATYALASTRVLGKRAGDTLVVRGRPILFGVTVPRGAPHSAVGERFVAYLLSAEGQRILRRTHFDALEQPAIVGQGAPAALLNIR